MVIRSWFHLYTKRTYDYLWVSYVPTEERLITSSLDHVTCDSQCMNHNLTSKQTHVWRQNRVMILLRHYGDVIMDTIASQITSLTIVYSTVYSDADQRKHQSFASLAFVCGIHRDRWIPRILNGQWRGKCFHLMTSSSNHLNFHYKWTLPNYPICKSS